MAEIIQIFHISGRFFSNSQNAFTLENEKKLGEKKENKIIYSPFEAVYLVETKKAKILEGNKELTFSTVINKINKKDREFQTKYLTFKDLRKKGYIVKAGMKFGADFRVYRKSDNHALWRVYPVSDSSKINIKELSSKNRIAHSTGKKLLIAIVDSEEDLSYYETNWIKP